LPRPEAEGALTHQTRKLRVQHLLHQGQGRRRARVGLVFFAIICWGSLEGAGHAWSSNEFEGEGALRVPVWPARFVLVLGTALAAFNYLLLLVQHLASAARGTAPQGTGTSH